MGAGKDLKISRSDSHGLYGSVDKDVMVFLMFKAVDFLIKNFRKTSTFHAASFYKGRSSS